MRLQSRSLFEKETRRVVLHGARLILGLHVHGGSSLEVVILLHYIASVCAGLTHCVWCKVSDWWLSRERIANIVEGAYRLRLDISYGLVGWYTINE